MFGIMIGWRDILLKLHCRGDFFLCSVNMVVFGFIV